MATYHQAPTRANFPDNPQIRPLAIVAGVACVITALTILLGPSLFRPAEWTQYHGVTASVVFLTIAFLHLRAEAWPNRKAAACGFVLLAAVGTFLIVGQSVGRQVEASDTEALSVEDRNKKLGEKTAELTEARTRLKYAEDRFEQEGTRQRCRDNCEHWKRTAAERRIVVKSIEAEIAALGPPKPVNAKAEAVAEFLAIFGVDRKWTIGAYALIEPFAKTMLFEFGSVLSFGYAFPHRQSSRQPSPADTRQTSFAAPSAAEIEFLVGDWPEPPKPGARAKTEQRERAVRDFIGAYRAKHGRDPEPREVRAAVNLPRSTAHRYQRRIA